MISAGKRVAENSTHRFRVGETVAWAGPQNASKSAAKLTEIVRLMPPLGTDLQYRIKSVDEKHEYVAAERDLSHVPQPATPVFPTSSTK